MTEKRTMSVKRALTRLKTIEAQLDKMLGDFSRYSTESSKDTVAIASTTGTLDENHSEARIEMQKRHQKYNDLLAEYTTIKVAIAQSNLLTIIDIGNKKMSIAEALLMESKTKSYMERLVSSVRKSELSSELKVQKFNDTISRNQSASDNTDYSSIFAKVDYLVDRKELEKTYEFLVEFSTELHGLIDETNVLTMLEI